MRPILAIRRKPIKMLDILNEEILDVLGQSKHPLSMREIQRVTHEAIAQCERAVIELQEDGYVVSSTKKAKNGRSVALWSITTAGISALSISQLARAKEKPITLSMRFRVFRRDNYKCQICGASAQQGATLEVDHKHPKAKGGSDDMSNLWTLCYECNRGKRDYDLVVSQCHVASQQDVTLNKAQQSQV